VRGVGGLLGAALLMLVLAAGCGGESGSLTPAAPVAPRSASPVVVSESPYVWSDCTALHPGDALTVKSFDCPEGQATIDMLNCANNETYVHMLRPGQEDLEGMMGVTTWLKAEPVPADDYRTRWARDNCHEVD
jgi:hypothetical protein